MIECAEVRLNNVTLIVWACLDWIKFNRDVESLIDLEIVANLQTLEQDEEVCNI